ncbi:hypothetical protein T459_25813 [Capsicum annuum]|uniref:Uncharacterized protein n=1 Tax=Capsicum annuum TaxID=4072 RepID=A0A2G2YLT5_CAPAN|nr:hypothetical protein T459_25813 [Capsicum annuum]
MFGMVVDGNPILLKGSTDLGIVAKRQMMRDLTGWEPPLYCFCGIRRILISKLAAYVKELDDITDDAPEIEVWAWEHIIPLQPAPHPLWANHHEASAPLERKWRRGIVHDNEARNILVIIRDVLDNLTIEQSMFFKEDTNTWQADMRPCEMYGFASKVVRISSESMNFAYLGTRLSFAPNYAPSTQSAESPPVLVCRHGRQSESRDSTRQGRRGGCSNMADRSEESHDNFGLSLATTIEAYYPTFEFSEPSTAVTDFSGEETVGFVTPPVVQYDFTQLSEFHHAPQPGMREFFMNNSPFNEALSFSDVNR